MLATRPRLYTAEDLAAMAGHGWREGSEEKKLREGLLAFYLPPTGENGLPGKVHVSLAYAVHGQDEFLGYLNCHSYPGNLVCGWRLLARWCKPVLSVYTSLTLTSKRAVRRPLGYADAEFLLRQSGGEVAEMLARDVERVHAEHRRRAEDLQCQGA